jgi:hypothetical protein
LKAFFNSRKPATPLVPAAITVFQALDFHRGGVPVLGPHDLVVERDEVVAALRESAVLHYDEQFEVLAGINEAVDRAGAEDKGRVQGQLDDRKTGGVDDFNKAAAADDKIHFRAAKVHVGHPAELAVGPGGIVNLEARGEGRARHAEI